jgi:hypothetical protein
MIVKYIFEELPSVPIQKEFLKRFTEDFSIGPDGYSIPIPPSVDRWFTITIINEKILK